MQEAHALDRPGGDGAVAGIVGITADSREVRPGYLFAALPGSATDGARFVPDALARGAVAVLAAPDADLPALPHGVRLIADDNPRRRFAEMVAEFYSGQPCRTVAVTGTNGKTSVADFTRQIWTLLGRSAGSLGTLGVVAPGVRHSGSLTTPDPVSLHRTLARLAASGTDRLALEASSHGLVQHRLDGIRLTAGAFTSFSRDHLDYHPDEQSYLAAKLRLFSELLPAGSPAVVCADDAAAAAVAEICRRRKHDLAFYGRGGDRIRIEGLEAGTADQVLTLRFFGRRSRVRLPFLGQFQALNVLCAAGLAVGAGEDTGDVLGVLDQLAGVPGRMQEVARTANGAPVYVDYAHKPEALENALGSLRGQCRGRLWVVFGCGGDRDRGKRPMMGAIAARLADQVIVTDDNPRSERPQDIRAEVMAGCAGADEIGDRREAIATAIAGLGPDDVLLIAGKGHEQGQVIGSRVLPFDDAVVARKVVADLDGLSSREGGGE